MTNDDIRWIEKLLLEKQIAGPVLELGVGYGGETCRELIERAGLKYIGTDLEKTPAVDFVADFERPEEMHVFAEVAPFGAVLLFNTFGREMFHPSHVAVGAFLRKPVGDTLPRPK